MQKCLCRHAAAVEAGTADGVRLDERDLHSKLRAAYCRDVSARAAADDNEIIAALRLRRGRLRRGSRCGFGFELLALAANDRNDRQAVRRTILRNTYFQERSGNIRIHRICKLVGLHIKERHALFDRVPDFFMPFDYRALSHGHSKLRHDDIGRH